MLLVVVVMVVVVVVLVVVVVFGERQRRERKALDSTLLALDGWRGNEVDMPAWRAFQRKRKG